MLEQALPQSDSTYKALQPFESIEELNAATKAHKQAHDLSQTERDILDVISRYSCVYFGVSYLSKNKIAKEVGRVRRTVIRDCQRLEALGIIEQYETRRVKGDRRQSANIIVIKSAVFVVNSEVQKLHDGPPGSGEANEVTPSCHTDKHFAKANKDNTYKETLTRPLDVIKRGLKHAIPAPIFDALEPFYNGQALYDTYGILLRAKARIDSRIALETHANRYIDAFYNAIRLFKAGKVRSLNGLLYVTWERLSAEISRSEGRSVSAYNPLYFDWLTD